MKFFRLTRAKRLVCMLAAAAIALNITNIFVSLLEPDYLFEHLQVWYAESAAKYNRSIDIISIGSIHKLEWQDAQQHTFVSHYTVRNFHRFNELNDTDSTCYTNLTQPQFNMIHQFCTRRDEEESRIAVLFGEGRMNFKPINATGWLCAQKRPIDGLYKALQPYVHHQRYLNQQKHAVTNTNYDGTTHQKRIAIGIPLPKYLIMMDDDTYLNMTFMIDILSKQYPYQQPYLLTGCLLQFQKHIMYKFPFGGYATILTQKAIENLIRPIYCTLQVVEQHGLSKSRFNSAVCTRLQQNLIGEQPYFRDGMSILDLMYTFSSSFLFTKVNEWTNGTGFCFHSDHALGYFLGFYYVGVPDRVWSNPLLTTDNAKERGYSYNTLSKKFDTCNNKRLDCGNSTTICHYNKPQHMYDMFQREHSTLVQ